MRRLFCLCGWVVLTAAVHSAPLLLEESFDYPDGALTTNSQFRWVHEGTGIGDLEIVNGQALLRAGRSENARLPISGAPLGPTNLYVSLNLNCAALPVGIDRVVRFGAWPYPAVVVSALSGKPAYYSLGLAASPLITPVPGRFYAGRGHTVVVRFGLSTGQGTRLWMDPTSELDTAHSVFVEGDFYPEAVTAIVLRQESNTGDYTVDNIKIGSSFPEVVERRPRLEIRREQEWLVLRWPDSYQGYLPQSSGMLWPPTWADRKENVAVEEGDNLVRLPLPLEPTFFQLIRR